VARDRRQRGEIAVPQGEPVPQPLYHFAADGPVSRFGPSAWQERAAHPTAAAKPIGPVASPAERIATKPAAAPPAPPAPRAEASAIAASRPAADPAGSSDLAARQPAADSPGSSDLAARRDPR
jgi:hypothetical protein